MAPTTGCRGSSKTNKRRNASAFYRCATPTTSCRCHPVQPRRILLRQVRGEIDRIRAGRASQGDPEVRKSHRPYRARCATFSQRKSLFLEPETNLPKITTYHPAATLRPTHGVLKRKNGPRVKSECPVLHSNCLSCGHFVPAAMKSADVAEAAERIT